MNENAINKLVSWLKELAEEAPTDFTYADIPFCRGYNEGKAAMQKRIKDMLDFYQWSAEFDAKLSSLRQAINA